jgi:hypothetical protein
MKCPHCLTSFHESWATLHPSSIDDTQASWRIRYLTCAECYKAVIELQKQNKQVPSWDHVRLVHPKSISRTPLSATIPSKFSDDYNEACLVLSDSPKSSAALSRRCLQNLLREKAKTTSKDLNSQIKEVLPKLPSYLADSLDAIRAVGNFAAHPIKSKNSGEIVDVEPGEAEWNLEVLESLFDFYFVQPEKIRQRREKLNKKLVDAGKPKLK